MHQYTYTVNICCGLFSNCFFITDFTYSLVVFINCLQCYCYEVVGWESKTAI